MLRSVALWLRPAGGRCCRFRYDAGEASWHYYATVLILEATLEPDALSAHEASLQRHAPGERAAVGVDPA